MIQGTTPIIRLKFPFSPRLLAEIEVSFIAGTSRDAHVVLSKVFDPGNAEESVDIPLTQEETRLMEGLTVIEVRAKTLTGGVIGFKHVPKYMRKTVSEVVL
ncbi:MAG: hypothetical protein ACI381_06665 [Candidatus Methanomethylophilaceae archaeon]